MPVIVAALSWSWRETEVDPLTGAVRANLRDRGPNGSELAALEHALRLAEGRGKCGDVSADRATGSFPAFLAASLGAAQALGCVRLEPLDEWALRVHRRLDGGRREVLIVRPPAVVSVEAAGVRLRRAGLPATLSRHSAPITVADAPAAAAPLIGILAAHPYRPRPRELPGPTGSALRRTLELTGALAPRTPPTVIGPLPPDQAASELLAYLRRCGYLAADDRD